MRALIFARVSTSNQSTGPQLDVLRSYCVARGWHIAEEIIEEGFSGVKLISKRPGLIKLMQLARSRKIDTVLVFKLDRLARSMSQLINILSELNELGVGFTSMQEGVDLTTSTGKLLTGILGAFAAFERDILIERTKAGIEHARKNGVVLGRPRTGTVTENRIRELRNKGKTYKEIAASLGVGAATISRALKVE